MSNAIAGLNALLYTSSDGGATYQKLGEIRDVTLSVKRDPIDVTSHDSAGKEYIPGFLDWTGKGEALYVDGDAGQDMVFNALVNGTTLKFRFLPKTGVGKDKYEGTGMITSWELAGPNTDAAAVSIDIQGTGTLTPGVQ